MRSTIDQGRTSWTSQVVRSAATAALGAVLVGIPERASAEPPNILFIVLDDVGIDQMGIQPFGWDLSPDTPELPVIQTIANAGVSFTNFWATPECSPTRACFLTGRWGHRTGVITAIVDPMLPSDQLNPVEYTVPKLIAPAGYRTAMIGKYHLAGGPENSPPGIGYNAPAVTAGLDFYDGYWSLPPEIDQTVGGQTTGLDCGGPNGSDAFPEAYETPAAACFPDIGCVEELLPFEAMEMGGLPLLREDGSLVLSCDDPEASCENIDWTLLNGNYAWMRTTVNAQGDVTQVPIQRAYLTTFISETSVDWIEQTRADGVPWMCMVTHTSSHTPIQTPPPSLVPEGSDAGGSCALPGPGGDSTAFKRQFKLMSESMDRSIGEMLLDLGLATMEGDVFTLVDPAETNTMIVVLGDNGSFGYTVNQPFNPQNAKQTVYETGVRVGCIVMGPGVAGSGAAVDAMVNVVDLFELFCTTAGVDYAAKVPPSLTIDAQPMSPYLSDPDHSEIRSFDFAIYGQGTFPPGASGACVLGNQVIDGLFTSEDLCIANGGCWLGGDASPYKSYQDYCGEVFTATCPDADGNPNPTVYCFPPLPEGMSCPDGSTTVTPFSAGQWAVRRRGPSSELWKLIVKTGPMCNTPPEARSTACQIELYRLATASPPDVGGIESDTLTQMWLPLEEALPRDAQMMYDQLRNDLLGVLEDEWYCPGDGNKDRKLDALDIDGVMEGWGGPSFWDVNEDGITDGADLGLILASWTTDCTGAVNPAGQGIPPCLIDP